MCEQCWADVGMRLGYLQHLRPATEFILQILHPRYFLLLLKWTHTHTRALPVILSLSPLPPSLPSLHRLFVGSAARVLWLHHIREFRGAGEGLDVELLKDLIWMGMEERGNG